MTPAFDLDAENSPLKRDLGLQTCHKPCPSEPHNWQGRFVSVKMRNCWGGLKGRREWTPENNNCISNNLTYSSQPSYQYFPSLISIPKADIKLWKMLKMWHPFGNLPGSCTDMFLKTACRSFVWISCTFFPWLLFCTEELPHFYPLQDKVPLKSSP